MLSVTASPSANFPDNLPVTLEALRKGAAPGVSQSGTVGTADLDAEAVTPAKLKVSAAYNYAAGALSLGVYSVTLSPAATSYVTGMEVKFKADLANLGAVDANVNGLGAKNLFKLGGEELEPGDIRAGMDVVAIYDGTNLQMISALGNRPTYIVPAADVAGTANAITLTLRPTPASLANLVGARIVFLAEADISVGGVTVNPNALGAVALKKNFSSALALNDIRNTQLVEMCYDGTNFQLISAVASRTDVPAIRGSYRGLALSPDATYPDHALTGIIKELVLEDASGNVVILRSLAPTCDVTQALQLNGRDNTGGGTEAASTWYHLWGVSDGTQFGTVLSTSATAPVMTGTNAPTWSYYAYLGAVYNDAGSNFVDFTQIDETVQIAETVTGVVPNTTAGTANVWNGPLSLGAVIPTTAQRVMGNMGTGGASALAVVAVSPYGSTKGIREFSAPTSGVLFNSFYVSAPYEVMVGPSQGFYWMSGNTTSQNRISITGWKYGRPYGG